MVVRIISEGPLETRPSGSSIGMTGRSPLGTRVRSIQVASVKRLRDETGFGIISVKEALRARGGCEECARLWLKEMGLAVHRKTPGWEPRRCARHSKCVGCEADGRVLNEFRICCECQKRVIQSNSEIWLVVFFVFFASMVLAPIVWCGFSH